MPGLNGSGQGERAATGLNGSGKGEAGSDGPERGMAVPDKPDPQVGLDLTKHRLAGGRSAMPEGC